MDFTATVKGWEVQSATARRIAAAAKVCPKPRYSRPEAVPGRGGRRQCSPAATRPGLSATRRRFKAPGAACRGRAAFARFGVAAAALLAEADRQPALPFVFVMLVCCFEVFALALVAVLAEWLFEALAWWSIAVANALAAVAMLSFLGRRHRQAWHTFHAVSRV